MTFLVVEVMLVVLKMMADKAIIKMTGDVK